MKLPILNGLLWACLVFSSNSFAQGQDFYYCKQTAGMIRVGMSDSQVLNTCGAPASKNRRTQPAADKVPIQQWVYNRPGDSNSFVNPNVLKGAGLVLQRVNNDTSMMVTIKDGKVSSLNFEGGSVNSVSICPGFTIQKGTTAQQVSNACGPPSAINRTTQNVYTGRNETVETWVYLENPNIPSSPQTRLTFKNGILQSID